VANGAEGEPGSSKDELLLTRTPHLVLDGILLAAHALDAREAIIGVERTRPAALHAVTHAVAERRADRERVALRVVPVPGRFVAGEESALVQLLNGGEAKPTTVPPRPFERGVGGRPTLVQNVETLAHLALVARHGPEWFRTLGTGDEPGTALVTVGGAVATPGVLEIAIGSRLASVVAAAGDEREPVSAYLIGGYFGTWVPRDPAWDTRLAAHALEAFGASLGAGVIHALPASACGLVESARVLKYLAGETAGQCGPCVNGLAAIADRLDYVARSRSGPEHHDALDRWATMIDGRGACHMPDGAVRFLRSTLAVFTDELAFHRAGRCRATSRDPVLPIPGTGRDWGWR
jgi:NADH:ubiquinone oxidoreductase subunit F (NADH-binding)